MSTIIQDERPELTQLEIIEKQVLTLMNGLSFRDAKRLIDGLALRITTHSFLDLSKPVEPPSKMLLREQFEKTGILSNDVFSQQEINRYSNS